MYIYVHISYIYDIYVFIYMIRKNRKIFLFVILERKFYVGASLSIYSTLTLSNLPYGHVYTVFITNNQALFHLW